MNKSVVIVGAQWGDEGKGKITNYLSNHALLDVCTNPCFDCLFFYNY